MHLPDNISWNLLRQPACSWAVGNECSAVYGSARKLALSPQTQLRIAGLLLVFESSKIRNKFPASLLPPLDYISAALGLGGTHILVCWKGFSSWLISSLYYSLPD